MVFIYIHVLYMVLVLRFDNQLALCYGSVNDVIDD